jgi:hypothetical protein
MKKVLYSSRGVATLLSILMAVPLTSCCQSLNRSPFALPSRNNTVATNNAPVSGVLQAAVPAAAPAAPSDAVSHDIAAESRALSQQCTVIPGAETAKYASVTSTAEADVARSGRQVIQSYSPSGSGLGGTKGCCR